MRKLIFSILILIFSFTSAPAETQVPQAPFPMEAPYTHQYQTQQFQLQESLSKARMFAAMQMDDPARTANMDLFDVTFYDLELEPDPVAEILSGLVTIQARVLDSPLETMDLNLQDHMTVSAVIAGGAPATFSHIEHILTVTLDRIYQPDEIVTLSVEYSGDPGGAGHFGWSQFLWEPLIWTLSQPYGSRHWWPCKDMMSDKADSVDLHITVSDNLIVASNGRLISETIPEPGKKTYYWQERHSISPYLVSLAIYPYTVLNYTYTALDGITTMPVDFYIIPYYLDQAEAAFPLTVDMIAAFAQGFGEYPFLDEKYGHAQYAGLGGMEHQTLTSLNYQFFQEWIISHELSHQWFGDLVTCADYHHIWLNEGLATWCEAYWREINEGMAAYHEEMAGAAYLGGGTIFVENPEGYDQIFNFALTYAKASWVPHMLRGQLGDETFFTALQTYLDTYAHSNATTEQFRDVMANVSGRNLDDFFQQWIYGSGYPQYLVSWNSIAVEGGTRVTVRVEQTQSEPPFFLQLPFKVQTLMGDEIFTVENDQRTQLYSFFVSGQVTDLQLDPEGWILREVTYGDASEVPDLSTNGLSLYPNAPNPFNPQTKISFNLESQGQVQLSIYDVTGRLVRVLVNEVRGAGEHDIVWDGRNSAGDQVASGTYFYRLINGENTLSRKMTMLK